MILRSLQAPELVVESAPIPAWQVIERTQREMIGISECWMITQPAHAALSGEIAAKLKPEAFGQMDESIVPAIAMHDAGWSPFDASAIQAARASGTGSKKSGPVTLLPFNAVSAEETIHAWKGSIEVAEKVSALGGYLVSEHFRSIAASQPGAAQPKSPEAMNRFMVHEHARQQRLRPKITLSDSQTTRLVEGLRFCDLLSLYVCCGTQESIEFPQQIAAEKIVLTRTSAEECSLAPFPFIADDIFAISALRHPKIKGTSSGTFSLKISARIS